MNFLLFFAVLGILLLRSRNFVPFWREAACDYGFLLLPFLLFCFCFLCRPRFVQLGFFAEPLLSTCLFNFLPFLLHILFVCLTRLRACHCVCVRPKKRSALRPLSSQHPPPPPPIHPIPLPAFVVAAVFLLLFIKTTAQSTSTPRRSQPSHSRGSKNNTVHEMCIKIT